MNIAVASIGTILFTRALGAERGATMSTIVLTIVVLIFGEVTPKSLAKEMPETVATAVSPMLNLLMVLFTPLTWLFSQWKRLLGHFVHSTEEDTITEGELMTMVSEAENDGELTDRESELIRSAIEFDDVEVEEILTPRVDVVAVEDNTSLDEVAQTFAESGYSRLPVYHDTIDNIIGVVHEKDFYLARLKKETSLEELVKPTLYTTGSTQISQLLRTLREQHHHLAVVVDEYGGTEGIITLEDILEELQRGRPVRDAGPAGGRGHRLQHGQRPGAGKDLPPAQGGRPLYTGRLRRRGHPHGQAPRDRSAPDPGRKTGTGKERRRKEPLRPHDF